MLRRVANTPPFGYDTKIFCHILLTIVRKHGVSRFSCRDIARNGVFCQETRALSISTYIAFHSTNPALRTKKPQYPRSRLIKYHYQRIHLPAIYAPLIFTGLFLMLWIYKWIVIVLFQNKIIYMPSMPPFARKEKIAD